MDGVERSDTNRIRAHAEIRWQVVVVVDVDVRLPFLVSSPDHDPDEFRKVQRASLQLLLLLLNSLMAGQPCAKCDK